jgi:WD40 repeat protein/transcriptional regulator with XRE-family HTH domain
MHTSIPAGTLEKFTSFGDMLRFLRRRAGITQLELAIAVGYSDTQISRLEQNQRLPDIPTLEARFVSALRLEDEPRAMARLLDLAANVRREDAPGLGFCPYKGLNYFDESDADLFIGREALTAKLAERIFILASSRFANETRFLAVIGASGSGKSSLVRAGLVPALRWDKKSADWHIHILTPTAHPLESLARSLLPENDPVTAIASLMDDLAGDTRSLQIFVKRKLRSENNQLLLVIDQFEELFALCRSEEERASFIENLLAAAREADGPVIVLIALRADFYAHCANYIQLREALAQNQEYIGTMDQDELQRAIEVPAQRGRWEFESGLVEQLLHEVGHEPGALPLLSHALMETWQKRRGRVMTLSGYASSGGIRGAIAETAEAVFTDRFTDEQQEIARRIFLRLTEFGDEVTTGDTRRRVKLDELILRPEERTTTQAVLKVLADARLITTDEDSIEVSHEALIREWPRLRGWLEENREELHLHRRLTEAAQEWQAQGYEKEYLYRGARLTQAGEWETSHWNELNELEHEYLAESSAWAEHETAEREAQQQRELEAAQKLAESEKQRAEQQTLFAKQLGSRAMYLTGAFIIALLMAFTALYFGSQARKTSVTAQRDRRVATSRELAAASLNNLEVDPERGILLALQSISTTRSIDGSVLPESLEALHRAILTSPIRMTFRGHGSRVLSASFSPDGKQLASIDDTGTVIITGSVNGKELFHLVGSTQPSEQVTAQRIEYSPDGKLLISCDSNQVKVSNPVTGKTILTLSGHSADVTAVTINRDGGRIASGSTDGVIHIWNTATGASASILTGHTNAIEGLTFSPDGKWLISTSDDATMKLWDAGTGVFIRDLYESTTVIDSVTFSPDGSLVAFSDSVIHVLRFTTDLFTDETAIADQEFLTIPNAAFVKFSPDSRQLAAASRNQIKVWDAATGREMLYFSGHTDWVMGVSFSPDGKSLASTSLDGTVKTWSLTPGQEMVTVTSQISSYGTRIAYNPNGKEFATNGGNGTATFWSTDTGEPQMKLSGHTQEVLSLAFSLDGRHFATGSLDETVKIWDVASGRELLNLPANKFGVRDLAFSPDGRLIASGGFDGTANVWDAETGTLIHEITGHKGLVLGVAFSPNGSQLATSSTDTTIKIWDMKTGELLVTIEGQGSGIRDIVYSPSGSLIAAGDGDGKVILWDLTTRSRIMTLTGHEAGIQSVAFSPDGKILASGSEDNTAKLWDVASGQEILTLPSSEGGVTGVAFSPSDNGAQLLISSGDGVTRILLLSIDKLIALAQSRVTRPLNPEECKKYLHEEQCP